MFFGGVVFFYFVCVIIISIFLLGVGLFRFSILLDIVLVGFMFLNICPYFLIFSVY